MQFDAPIDRRNTHCVKWDGMEGYYGVSPDDGIAMWVADMEFRAADPIKAALQGFRPQDEQGRALTLDPFSARAAATTINSLRLAGFCSLIDNPRNQLRLMARSLG